jgi:molecular chaperone GrpE
MAGTVNGDTLVSDVDSKNPEETPSPEPSGNGEPAEASPLAALEAERDKLKDQLLRTAADFDNFRKRARKDIEQAERRGKEDALRELLPVFDNLERAVGAASGATDVTGILQGIEMVLKLFEDTASRLGLERLQSVGQRFDPMLHDAFQQQPSADHAPGTILAEYQSGYKLGDKLIRPAMVVVAKKPDEPKGDA